MEQEEDALIYGLQMINGHNARENRTPIMGSYFL